MLPTFKDRSKEREETDKKMRLGKKYNFALKEGGEKIVSFNNYKQSLTLSRAKKK